MLFVHVLLIFLQASSALAQAPSKESVSGGDYLIKKLEGIYSRGSSSNASQNKAVALRLAHMLALRAEEKFLEDRATCPACYREARQDARKALKLYKQQASRIQSKHPSLYTSLLFGQAHLHHLLGESHVAIQKLKTCLRRSQDKEMISKAYFNLGNVYYDTHDYRQAIKNYDKLLKIKDQAFIAPARYKKIWSFYRLSFYKQALREFESFVSSPEYLQVSDKQEFIKDHLEKDMLSFYSKAQPTRKNLEFLYNFDKRSSRENTKLARRQRLYKLAQSLHRVGRLEASNKVWDSYLSKDPKDIRKLEVYYHKMRNSLDAGSELAFQNLLKTYQRVTLCYLPFCEKLADQSRKYLLRLRQQARSSKKRDKLLSYYLEYNKLFPGFEIQFQAGLLAKSLKKYKLAGDLFQSSAGFLRQAKDFKNKERASFLQLEVAELSGDLENRLRAYDFYLQTGSDPKKLFQASYQKNYILYSRKKYKVAARKFRELALVKFKQASLLKDQDISSLTLKSAHLALSSLNFDSENDQLMQAWSEDFSKRFPKHRQEFLRINHTAIFNSVKNLLGKRDFSTHPVKPSSDRSLKKAWKLLDKVQLAHASSKEKIKYHLNRLLLAKEMLMLDEASMSSRKLLQLPLDKKTKKQVLGWTLWLAEARFNFKEAFRLTKLLKPNSLSKDYLLRTARLAELSGENFLYFYERVIKEHPESPQNLDIILHILDLVPDRKKSRFLKKYARHFSKDTSRFTYLVLKLDKGKLDPGFLKQFTSFRFMQDSFLSNFIKRKAFIENFNRVYLPVSRYSLTMNPKKLTPSLKRYGKMISRIENQAKRAIDSKDWTLQTITFSRLEQELVRFVQAVRSVPIPAGLTQEEKQGYTSFLEGLLAPYVKQAEELKSKLKSLWQKKFLLAYKDIYRKDVVFHSLASWELAELNKLAPESFRKYLASLPPKSKQNTPASPPASDKELKQAYANVRKDPFNRAYLQDLLKFEQSRGNKTLTHYIKNRLEQM